MLDPPPSSQEVGGRPGALGYMKKHSILKEVFRTNWVGPANDPFELEQIGHLNRGGSSNAM